MRKRILVTLLSILLCYSVVVPAGAIDLPGLSAASKLHELGLFQGAGTNADGSPNYDLDRTPTRMEGVTMLVRLLGKDVEAQSGVWSTPFTDVAAWAKPYVGYAYEHGLTKGVSETTFGGDSKMDAAQYITLVLRAMGYADEEDFQWSAPWILSDELGITDGSFSIDKAFTRADVASISYNAMSAQCKSEVTLAEQLVAAGIFTQEQAIETGVMTETPITRADAAHFFAGYLESKDPTPCNYADVTEETPYFEDIYALTNAGMAIDMGIGLFMPDSQITIAEFSSILSRLLTTRGYSAPSFTYSSEWDSAWYGPAMTQMVDLGIFPSGIDPFEAVTTVTLHSAKKNLDALLAGELSVPAQNADRILFKDEPVKYISIGDKLYSLAPTWNGMYTGYLKLATVTMNGESKLYVTANMGAGNTTDAAGIGELLSYVTNDYEITSSDNPFVDGNMWVRDNSLIDQKGVVVIEMRREYTSIDEYDNIVTLTAKGKTLVSSDFPAKEGKLSAVYSIPFFRGYLEVDGLLEYFGIDKTVTLVEQDDVLVLRIQ